MASLIIWQLLLLSSHPIAVIQKTLFALVFTHPDYMVGLGSFAGYFPSHQELWRWQPKRFKCKYSSQRVFVWVSAKLSFSGNTLVNKNLVSWMFMDNNQENSSKSHPSKEILLLFERIVPNSFVLTSSCLVLAKDEISISSLFLVLLSFFFFFSGKGRGCSDWCWDKFLLLSAFDTHFCL